MQWWADYLDQLRTSHAHGSETDALPEFGVAQYPSLVGVGGSKPLARSSPLAAKLFRPISACPNGQLPPRFAGEVWVFDSATNS